ncbi:hypothetical protein [Sphaerospermopsis sp. LEGE 08334]|jgi:hypothetical protein|uniref:hypothetical protein n=1 Tax=Sphaerospermopsis sp. LEGE 08334 TaxID=1828651 RepID=UPI0018815B10|nr:hypothetical protein [Sphaerospermopsis sp. LEGE 08334]MBE9058929.1 hypothetical protein [Sphaerospermopsis sp. LEGE 08334]
MVNKKSSEKIFQGMSYREIQKHNSQNRIKLSPEDQKWLKENGYKNLGWDNVINLYNTIQDFLVKYQVEDLTLEELFLEADRIGNKYLTEEEIQDFQQELAKELNEISEEIDKQFPQTEIEIIDFSQNSKSKPKKKRNQKTYRTVKF